MAVTGIDEGKLRSAFLEEAEDLVQKLNASLSALESDGEDPTRVHEVFRLVHSLKSESAVLGFTQLSELAHRMEDVLGLVRDGSLSLEKHAMETVFAGSDLIAEMISAIAKGGGDSSFDTQALLRELGGLIPRPEGGEAGEVARAGAGDRAEEGPSGPVLGEPEWSPRELSLLAEARDRGETLYRVTVTVDPEENMKFPRAYLVFTNLEMSVNVVKTVPPMTGEIAEDSRYGTTGIFFTTMEDEQQIARAAEVDQVRAEIERLSFQDILPSAAPRKAPAPQKPEDQKNAPPEKTTIRVDTRRLDDLWSLIAELIQQKAHISRLYERIARKTDPQMVRQELGETFDSLDKISTSMQQVMMETRMIPISVIFNKFPRLVRDLSRKLGKRIDLAVSGEETEIDRGIVEALSDPLTHIIRNSIDHGIESPEEREKLGKPEKGKVRISAYQQGQGIVIELEDDGRGINLERIREKAVAMGIPGAQEMSEEVLMDLIFLPGFSTREVVTDLSGRGVGMDVVATRIRGDLKGDVTITTMQGEGTLITLRLPLTFTISNALLVRAESVIYALPLSGVDSTAKILNTEIRGDGGRRTCTWGGEEIPLYYLGGLQGKGMRRAEEYFALILTYGMDRACLVVDELLEEQDIVIKPIDDLLNGKKRFSGISVLEDGTPVYILDISFVQEGSL